MRSAGFAAAAMSIPRAAFGQEIRHALPPAAPLGEVGLRPDHGLVVVEPSGMDEGVAESERHLMEHLIQGEETGAGP